MDPYLGEIRLFPWEWAPKGWALCAGQLLSVNQFQALFALLGTTYGGNGTTNFALPDLRGRVAIDRSTQEPQGTRDGTEMVTLTSATMPSHTHALIGTSTTATLKAPTGNALANDTSPATDFYAPASGNPLTPLSPTAIGLTGGTQAHNNMQPFLVLNYCIATSGIFPSRN
ncbi:phage tail protein [Sphingomonas sp. MMS24-J45]|uniref:phage tail protein n=1 Tax=Sphingomonas sp. MMS24-J45 TaxID=3238806 RepID=UPI00384C33FD